MYHTFQTYEYLTAKYFRQNVVSREVYPNVFPLSSFSLDFTFPRRRDLLETFDLLSKVETNI